MQEREEVNIIENDVVDMKINEKRDFLESLEEYEDDLISSYDIGQLQKLAVDKSSDIRSDVASILVKFINDQTKEIIINLMGDRDTLVRTEATDSASVFCYEDIYQMLSNRMIYDSYYLVRGYAIKSLTKVGVSINKDTNQMVELVRLMLSNEKNRFCKLCIFEALYVLGDKQCIHDIINIYKSKNYRTRCATVMVLQNILSAENRHLIDEFVDSISKEKEVPAVEGCINNLVQALTGETG